MRRLLISLLLAVFAVTAQAAPRPLPSPKIYAVYFYADWCPNCKALSPKLKDVRLDGKLEQSDVLFVTMDLTDKKRIHQSILLAQGLGIGDYLRSQGSATGYVALLDAKTKKEIVRFDRANSVKEIRSGIEKALTG